MKLTFPRRLLARKVIRNFAIASLCAITVAGVVAQSPFDPALERQLWKTLLPLGGDLAIPGPDFVPVPRRTSVNTPSPVSVYSWTDENNVDIYRSQTIPSSMPGSTQEEQAENAYNAEVDLLRDGNGSLAGNEGACTFSHRDDWDGDGPQWRQCVIGGRMLPPPPGALLDPVGLAVDGTTVYVVDDLNQRVQAFDFDGRVKPMKYPIGNGIPGSGTYSYSNYKPYETFPGYEAFDGGYSGSQLKAPNGIAVDGSHQLAIADSGNYRIAVFQNDGSAVFSVPMPEHLGIQTKPTLVAVTPGSMLVPPGTPLAPDRENDRVVVTDWSHCMVHVYKSNFELVKSLPEALPAVAAHDACKAADPSLDHPAGTPTFNGEFSTVTGVAIDQAGHIYVTDHAQNAVQVLDINGTTLGWIGKPGVQAAPGALSGPVGVAIDHLGRVGVIDAGNSRVVFYSVNYSPANVPSATFEFQLDTVVSVEDFPMGLAEQWGETADGLDPKGRFVATDAWGKQILRFELPELAIADAQAAILAVQPVGQPADQLTGRGTFKVAVPRQKDGAVLDVETFVEPVEAGVSVVPGSITPSNDEVPGIDIAPGEYAAYEFTYTTNATVTQATFLINARGDFDGTTYLAEADEAQARSRASCVGCDATHEVHWLDQDETPGLATPTTNPTTGTWYPAGVFVRLLPTPADGSITHIAWYYDGASEIFYSQHGETQESALGTDGHVDVPVGVNGATTLTYWAITAEGSIGDPHTVDLNIDLTPPTATFLFWPPHTGTTDSAGQRWYNHDVTAGYVTSDVYSGTDHDAQTNPALPDGQLFFTAEGRAQSQNLVLTDRVGHAGTFNSATASGGRLVNIDTVAPAFTSLPQNPIVLTVNGEDELGSYALVHPNGFSLAATDPALSNGEPGSGVANVTNPGMQKFRYGVTNTWTYTATDHAGNSTSLTVDVVVQQGEAVIGGPDASVTYGGRLVLHANIAPRSATGTVTFAFGPYTVVAPVQTVSGNIDPVTGATTSRGEALAVVDPVMIDVGLYPMTAVYSGDQVNSSASTQMTVNVMPRAVSVMAVPQQKYAGQPDPALTYTTSGLIGNDTLTATLLRADGETLGSYPIMMQSVAVSPNYLPTFIPEFLSIIGRVTVTPESKTILYGDSAAPYSFSLSPVPAGGVLLTPPVCGVAGAPAQVGSYTITCGGATGSFLEFVYDTSTLTINKRPAALIAGSGSKLFGTVDPPLTTTQAGILAADVAGITLTTTRAAGSAVGTYPTTATATGGASGNYEFSVTPGVFTILAGAVNMTLTGGTFTYDGASHPATCTVVDVLGAQLPGTITYTPGGTTAPRNAGTYTATCAFAGTTNYQPLTQTAAITINKKDATIFAGSGSRLVGAVDPLLTTTQSGIVAGDLPTFTLITTRTTGEAVGNYPTTANATGVNANNYNFTVVPGNFRITATVLVTPNAQTITYGDAQPALTFTYGAFPAGYSAASVVQAPVCTVAGAHTNAGDYTITCSGGSIDSLVSFTYGTAPFKVNKKAATITANAATREFGKPNPTFTAVVTGVIGGDTLNYTLSTPATTTSPVGTYDINVTVGTNPNYAVTAVKGILTVTPVSNQAPFCGGAIGGEIWPPNHKRFYAAPITGVTDPEGQAVTIVITGIWQDEQIDSTGDGKFSPDGQGVGTNTAWVRAERNGHQNKATGNGRVYEILFTATDTKGASCNGSVLWTVPHDQGKGSTAIDSGVRYDSTGVIPGARDKSQIHQKSPTP